MVQYYQMGPDPLTPQNYRRKILPLHLSIIYHVENERVKIYASGLDFNDQKQLENALKIRQNWPKIRHQHGEWPLNNLIIYIN